MLKKETKKQVRQNAVLWMVFGLILSLGAVGLFYWDYREQVKFHNIFERGSGIDFKTGKVDPNFQPKPFKYRFDISGILPLVGIFGGLSLLFLLAAVFGFRKSSTMSETPEMIRADAERETLENLPEVKNLARQDLIIRLLPFFLLIPVPFIAMYGLGAVVFAVYILFVAIAVGASYFVVPRLFNKK